MASPEPDLVTVSDVAKMAGTARSTVSNWKRRHADFPTAREQTPRGPLYDRGEVVAWLSGRGLPVNLGRSERVGAEFVTPTHLVRFATQLLDERAAVLDPACGTGGFLAECAATAKLICGQELNPDIAELTQARLAQLAERHGGRSDVQAGNALLHDRFPTLFDGVICAPPWRQRLEPGLLPEGDARWVFDYPRTSGDAAWIQHVVAHLAPGGRAVMVLAPGTLSDHGVVGSVRAGLIRSGFLRAVIHLPNSTLAVTSIAPVLWVLERPVQPTSHPTVLLAQPLDDASTRRGGWPAGGAEGAAEAIRGWLDGRVVGDDLPPSSYREVSLEQLAMDDFDLTPRRHLVPTEAGVPLAEVRAELELTVDATRPELDRLATAIGAARDLAPLEGANVQRIALSDVAEVRRGVPSHQLAHHGEFAVHTPGTLLRGETPTRYLSDDAPELQTAAPRYNAVPGDVLVTLDGTIGEVHLVTEEMFVSSAFAILRPKPRAADLPEVEPSFLAAWLRSAEIQQVLQHLPRGATIRRVAAKDLARLAVPTPERDIQLAVAAFDDKLRAAIDAVRDLARTVERLAQLGTAVVAATLPEEGR